MNIHTLRAGEGLDADIAREVWERYKAGGDVGEAVRDALVQLAIDKFRPKIAAAMRRAGLDIADDAQLDAETITRAIRDKTGLELDDLSPDSVAAAMDAHVARELSALLGVEVSSVLDLEGLKAQVVAAAVQSVQSGRASALMSAAAIKRVRAAATWQRAGLDPSDREKVLDAWYQKKYRRTHRQVWD